MKRGNVKLLIMAIILFILIIILFFMQYNKIVLSGQAVREIEGDNTNVTNNTKNSDEVFIIEDVTNDDILNDRIKITSFKTFATYDK